MNWINPAKVTAYDKISASGKFIYFEINPLYIKEIKQMLAKNNLNDVNFKDDFEGKKRFVKITF